MKKLLPLIVLAAILNRTTVFAQTAEVKTVQPKIIVIPFTKENEDIRTVLESDVNRRVAISKVKEEFDNRGFTTVDFTAKLKSAIDDGIFTSGSQTDIKSALVEYSGADIYVEVEVPEMISTASGNAARIILQAFDVSTANSLANKVCESPKFHTTDYGALVTRALSKNENLPVKDGKVSPCVVDFLNVMQTKFDDIVANGRSIKVNFSLAQGSKYKFSTELKPDGLPFSDVLENWMAENAVKNNYHIQGVTDVKVFFDDVRIPLKDEKDMNYSPNKFGLKIYQFLKSKNINCSRQVKNGTIFITIN
ncbi:MAG: hypothetical protein JNM19_17830 [Chitinophagaceae bacterium]|nr:hypothetical protein [Chitinophagaceae bacterium]